MVSTPFAQELTIMNIILSISMSSRTMICHRIRITDLTPLTEIKKLKSSELYLAYELKKQQQKQQYII